MSAALFKASARSNWLIGAIILAIMMMYMVTIVFMYDPAGTDALNAMLATLPEGLVKAMGYSTLASDLTGFIASYYYGFIVVMFPLIYSTIVANRLVAMHVDRGSMAYLLSTPNSRLRIAATQAVYLIVTVTLLFALLTAAGVAISAALFPGELEIDTFLWLNLYAWLLFCAVSGISFFFSCVCNESKYAVAFGAGLPVLFWVMDMLANVSSQLDWLRALTLFSLFQPQEVLAGTSGAGWAGLVLVLVALTLYGAGIALFNRRDLHL